jgi:hypothetical protein
MQDESKRQLAALDAKLAKAEKQAEQAKATTAKAIKAAQEAGDQQLAAWRERASKVFLFKLSVQPTIAPLSLLNMCL